MVGAEPGDEELRALRVLVVADVYAHYGRLAQLSEWRLRRGERLDLLVCLGNLIPPATAAQQSTEDVAVADGESTSVLAKLEDIVSRVLYVPAQHDSPSLWQAAAPQLSQHAANVDGRRLPVAPGLSLAGVGGSRTADGLAPRDPPNVTGCVRSDALLAEGLESALSSDGSSGDEVVLCLATGPSGVSTTLDCHDAAQEPVDEGCGALRPLLAQPETQRRVALLLHGGAPNSQGTAWLGDVRTVNPGCLEHGSFAIVDLQHDSDGRWSTAAVELHTLDAVAREPCCAEHDAEGVVVSQSTSASGVGVGGGGGGGVVGVGGVGGGDGLDAAAVEAGVE